MRTRRLARVLDPEELGRNFGGGPQWMHARWTGLDFFGTTESFEVELKAGDPLWHLSVEAVDDPSDSEELVTPDPVRALGEFLSRGLPGGSEFFRDRSAALRRLARLVRTLPVAAVRRHLLAALAADGFELGDTDAVPTRRRGPSAPAGGPDEWPDEGALTGGLVRRMRSKGWDVSQGETDWGGAELRVRVGDEYSATVRVDSIPFSYSFSVKGTDSVTDSGVTDDPIREFRRWYRDPEVETARQEANAGISAEEREAVTGAPEPA